MSDIYITKDGKQSGPYSQAQIQNYVSAGVFGPDDFGWREGMADWVALRSLLPLATPPPPPKGSKAATQTSGAESDKRILPALLLWFFLGAVGAHHFYVGSIVRGVAYLACLIGIFVLPPALDHAPAQLAIVLTPLPMVLLGVGLLADMIRIVTGNFPDGSNRKIRQWT